MSAGAKLEIAVKKHVQEITKSAVSRATRGLNIMRNCALEVLSQETHGRVYSNGRVASTPGATPNPQFGNLRKNWQLLPVAISANGGGVQIRMRIRSDMKYAVFLDKGTRKMAPRPFRQRIQEKAKPKIAQLFSNL